MMTGVTRRGLLLGGAGLALAACSAKTVLPGHRATVVSGTSASAAMGGIAVGWSIAYPKGHGPGSDLPVVVSLHGKGGNHETSFGQLHLDTVLGDVVAGGVAPFAIASVDGGTDSYWHKRADGTDAGAMLRDEFIPFLAKRGLDTDRIGFYGWSMGGYGALLQVGRYKVSTRAVAVSSPALFTSAQNTAAGAFDSASDFDDNNVYGNPQWFGGDSLMINCGRSDPFFAATQTFASGLSATPAGGFGAGGHDATYWRSVAPAQFRFLGHQITAT
ncbi:MAG TPA: esterase [Marmoricola sp.]|nr:esterase [Marmoricola sp.]